MERGFLCTEGVFRIIFVLNRVRVCNPRLLYTQLGGLNNRLQISRCFLNENGDHLNGAGLQWSKHGLRLNRVMKLSDPNAHAAEQILSWEANRKSRRLLWQPLMLFLLEFCEKSLHDVQKIPERWKCPKDARLIFRTKIERNRKFVRFGEATWKRYILS